MKQIAIVDDLKQRDTVIWNAAVEASAEAIRKNLKGVATGWVNITTRGEDAAKAILKLKRKDNIKTRRHIIKHPKCNINRN